MDCEIVRNSFAIECFRNVADEDYIAARSAYRIGMMNHFLWTAMQAIEKYLKGILLINGLSTIFKRNGHNLVPAYERASSIPRIGFSLPSGELHLLNHLSSYGGTRYLEAHIYTRGDELPILDSLVWLTRRFCQPLNYESTIGDKRVDMLPLMLEFIHNTQFKESPSKFRIVGGLLEEILGKKADPRRSPLVWGNHHYGPGQPLKLMRSQSVNPPHIRRPSERACLDKLVHFPKNPGAGFGAVVVNGTRIIMGSFQIEGRPPKKS